MIIYFAVALVLGASAVLGSRNPSCSDLRHDMLQRTGLSAGDTEAMETSRFQNPIALQLTGSSTLSMIIRKAYVVQPGQESSLPTVTVNGNPYRMYYMELIPLDAAEGTAAAEIVFTYEKPNEQARDISFFVPVLTVENDDPDLSEGLNKTLDTLNSAAEGGVYKITFEWLEALLEKVISAMPNVQNPTMEKVKLYLTNCQNVASDTIHPLFLFGNLAHEEFP